MEIIGAAFGYIQIVFLIKEDLNSIRKEQIYDK